MIYLDSDYLNSFQEDEPEEDKPPRLFFNSMESFNWDDDDNLDDEAFDSLCLTFAESYVKRALPLVLSFYPQFRSKKKALKEALLEEGENMFERMYDMNARYMDGKTSIKIIEPPNADICIHDINSFIHNNALDHLLENYDAWFKRKISFENIYVESFCAGAYIKHMHNLLINMLHHSFPSMTHLSPEQLDHIYADLTTAAWDAYDTLTSLDQDELNGTDLLVNLEDYEFETLLLWKGPEVTRNAKGKITCITIPRNFPSPDKVPALCAQCKRFYDRTEINILCIVYRFDHRNAEDFKCRAYENK